MRYVQKVLSYTRKHIDFLIVDIVTYLLSYYAAVQIRRSMSIPIHHGELFLKFGLVFSILLSAGIIIHRSLGESVFDYATQHINDVAGKYVITIEGAQVSVARKAEKLLRQVRKKWKVYRTKRKDKEDRAA